MTLNNTDGAVDLRRWFRTCIAVASVLVVLTVLIGAGIGGPGVSTWALAVAAGVAASACGWRARLFTGRARWGWAIIGAGLLSWGAGLTYTLIRYWPDGGVPDIPSPADAGYLGLLLLVPIGLLTLPSASQPLANRIRSVLDGLLMASSLVLVSWVFVVEPRLDPADNGLAFYLTLLYPLGDIVIATMIGYMLPRRRELHHCSADLTIVGLGVVAFTVSDIGYAYLRMVHDYQSGSRIDLGWLIGFGLIVIGAARPRNADPLKSDFSLRARTSGLMLPYVAVGAALFSSVLFHVTTGHSHPFVAYTRSLLILLLIGRQVLTLLENRELTRTLEARVKDRTADLYAREQQFHALVRHSSDVVTVIDATGRVTFQSESVLAVFGYRPEDFLGRHFTELLDVEVSVRLAEAMRQVAARPYDMVTLEVEHTHQDGRKRPSEMIVTNLVDDPHVAGFVLNTRDISERKELQEQLVHEAYHDGLTQLANRPLFRDKVAAALQRTRNLTVLHLDLDGFKRVNDSLGHQAGDQLLVQVADRIQGCVRAGDVVARFGADEFAVLVEAASGDEAEFVARRILDDLELPVEVGARNIHVRASIGLAQASLLDETEDGAEQLLRNADLAMHHAKAVGGSVLTSFRTDMHEGLIERLELENDLRAALENQQLRVHYQPTVDLDTSRVVGFEALVRWPHPTRGMINPLDFIPIAEATGLIAPLGRWVLHEACRQAVEWSEAAGGRPLKMSVNVSVRQLDQTDFAEIVAAVLAETGMPADRLCLEMTESVLMTDTEANLEQLVRLKALGLTLAIDDFGTGYSSLAYLRRFPVDTLKIDRSFVERLGGVLTGDTALTDTIVRLGKSLGMSTVAEGIEEFGQLAALRAMGCGFAQGYYFSRPVPPAEAGRLFLEGADTPLEASA